MSQPQTPTFISANGMKCCNDRLRSAALDILSHLGLVSEQNVPEGLGGLKVETLTGVATGTMVVALAISDGLHPFAVAHIQFKTFYHLDGRVTDSR